ncbi:MAG: hypothetical protein LBS01_10030 [Prevotellaceae bacterium]|jgi:hypothetical protein|nr:hypothetical protein [Prevotellaceae bacterium]
MINELKLPDLILLEDYNGNFALYYDAVYAVFVNDFVRNRPEFRGKRLGLKKYPFIDGKEYTYYHFTHSGNIEVERIPDIRRMERIGYPKPIIAFSDSQQIKVWRNKRGTSERILLFHEEERYLVVLEERKDYILPWTAYPIEQNSRLRKLLAEYQDFMEKQGSL